MWCIPTVTPLFITRMEHLLELYARPYNAEEPVVCLDEKSKQLLGEARQPLALRANRPKRTDYEYVRRGTRNIFVAVEPQAGYRQVTVTKRRTKRDFAHFIKNLVDGPYQEARTLHIVLDNLNTHFTGSLTLAFGEAEAARILAKIEFHYTPKHASWLNMAEIEIGIMSSQALKQKFATDHRMKKVLAVWQTYRNRHHEKIHWRFTVVDARRKFKYNSTKLS